MKKNHSCNALKALKIIRIILSIILLSYTLSLCIIGHCASDEYFFPMQQNENGHFTEIVKISIDNYLDSDNYYIFSEYWAIENNWFVTYYVRWPKSDGVHVFSEIYSNAYQFSLYRFPTDYSSLDVGYLRINMVDGSIGAYNATFDHFYGLGSSSYYTGCDYVSNFQLYTNNTDSKKIVLMYSDGEEIIPDGDTASEDMEKPDISDYIPDWNNTPTFDNSSLENALESVYNGIVWFANNVKDTITGSAEYMADTVRWSIQKVLDTLRAIPQAINEKIQEVKNAILTVVDKIQDTFDYISQPFDSNKINTAFNNMAIKSDYNNMTTLVNNAVSVFDSTAEPNTFRIPVHLENIPILHINEVQYIDLGWIYNSRSIIRAFMWCVTTFSLLYTIIDALPSYLQGNDE